MKDVTRPIVTGLGTDIIEIARIQGVLSRQGQRFKDRVFTLAEQKYCDEYHETAVLHYAGRFAAKEAIAKALGIGIGETIGWLDIEIINDPKGSPKVSLKRAFPTAEILLSISHCKEYATAVAIVLT